MVTDDGDKHDPSSEVECSPIAIFAYNRPGHLERLIDSLLQNELHARSEIVVFCDGPRHQQDRDAVAQTRRVAHGRLGSRARIVERETNQGLARSIIGGVTELCQRFGSAIVLEDDLVLHSGCLGFLNAALRRFADDARVLHVNAYRYPIPPASAPSFSRLTSSWGWATWQRAWMKFEPDADALQHRIRKAGLIGALDFDGAFPFYRMLQNQARGKLDSWAIRWYASSLLAGGLAISPNVSQVSNHGFDSTGVHCEVSSIYNVEPGTASEDWPGEIEEDMSNFRQMQAFFRSSNVTLPRRVLSKFRRLLSTN
jgi:hypothetical protein